ncbi:hypothetical protein NIM87_00095 [Devosia sp. XJ19-1]|uniref:Uncharacterized protein n=1 Tax=Devosia ureilytica TaxID=2952754 RepID=A0A9Q4ALV0_9HYPH|nr:hypothetical protein [Devosia ureilytica]MCP8881900.1 hypothetical protein [Devosia ureilytica]MCP8886214.1 hypothetical protein [Devosia ureilytica]
MTQLPKTAAQPPGGLVIIGLALASWWLLLIAGSLIVAAWRMVAGA